MKATDLLKKDHDLVKRLFQRIEEPSSAQERGDLYQRIQQELSVHTRIEEEIFYPALRRIGTSEAEELYEEAQEEHGEAKKAMQKLSKLDPSSADFILNLGKLIQGVEHHIKEEEEGLFPLVQKRIPKARQETLGAELEERKEALTGQRGEAQAFHEEGA